MKVPKRFPPVVLLCGLVLILAFGLAACQATPTPTEAVQAPTQVPTDPPPPPTVPPEPTATTAPPPTPTEEPQDFTAFIAAWESGPHGNTYDLGKGPNTYCSRCHSPQNWDPEATTDKPPNCVTCKFATDPELRIATTMDFVEEEDWKGIGCETCHVVESGLVQPGNAWLNPLTSEYEDVATTTELCEKCHVTTQGVSASGGRGVDHKINMSGSAHIEWAGALPQVDRPDTCTDCHDPHTAQPKQCVDCHDGVLSSDTHIKGLNDVHSNVTCLACHDASGAEVGPHPDEAEGGKWVTVLSGVSRSGEPTFEAIVSHSIKWEVACDRCHFEGNTHGLTPLTETGDPIVEESSN